jgi:hippurate hydrolase
MMGAEDFSYVLAEYPGAVSFLGVCPAGQDPSTAARNHSDRMVLDESVLHLGAAIHAGLALEVLGRRG